MKYDPREVRYMPQTFHNKTFIVNGKPKVVRVTDPIRLDPGCGRAKKQAAKRAIPLPL